MDDVKGRAVTCNSSVQSDEEMDLDLRRGPWTVEEDLTLINYVAHHGEGRWNSLARCAGLNRTGKSCRLRWLNYLRPDVRRGNITLEEQLLILELHSRWGNRYIDIMETNFFLINYRWSKIAQQLPGRTDNEIKNYWRTRVQKHAKQLKCDVNSKQFKDTMRYLWMPRLVERIQAAATANGVSSSSSTTTTAATATISTTNTNSDTYHYYNDNNYNHNYNQNQNNFDIGSGDVVLPHANIGGCLGSVPVNGSFTSENCSTVASSDSVGTQVSPVSDLTDCYNYPVKQGNNQDYFPANQLCYGESLISPNVYFNQGLDFQATEQNNRWMDGGDLSDNLWNAEDIWFLQQQFNNNV
ncbi:unnamed protein product [Ilex paraguariensis]|uniref:Uncharacterized protein n=1 Tax=Ilex paraguariensis TaxID=185542 RepID=A0ABC8U8W0_9AQUA